MELFIPCLRNSKESWDGILHVKIQPVGVLHVEKSGWWGEGQELQYLVLKTFILRASLSPNCRSLDAIVPSQPPSFLASTLTLSAIERSAIERSACGCPLWPLPA